MLNNTIKTNRNVILFKENGLKCPIACMAHFFIYTKGFQKAVAYHNLQDF